MHKTDKKYPDCVSSSCWTVFCWFSICVFLLLDETFCG